MTERSTVKISAICFIVFLLTVWGLAKVAIFTTNVDAENQCLFNHKCVCGALNRHFCQTRVGCCRYSPFILNLVSKRQKSRDRFQRNSKSFSFSDYHTEILFLHLHQEKRKYFQSLPVRYSIYRPMK